MQVLPLMAIPIGLQEGFDEDSIGVTLDLPVKGIGWS